MLLQWVPNALTISRGVLAIPMALAAGYGHWTLAFWIFVIALLTDFFDGWAARRFKVATHRGAELDALADSALVAGGFIGLTFAGVVPVWLTTVVLAGGACVGSRWFFWPKSQRLSGIRILAGVACLFIAWIAIAWMLAVQIYGWSWWYAIVTIAILAVLTRLKRHRIKTWAQG
jgi:phosphatidylglycerophosphate synthase